MKLKDQAALVTGGSRGIGRAIAKALAAEGAQTAIVYRGNAAAAESLVAEITAAGGTALAIQADIGDPNAGEQVVKQVVDAFGRLDVLVNNAGIIQDGLFVRLTADEFNKVITTNLTGTVNFCRAAVNQMVFKQRYGRIINISSVAATHVNQGQTNYSASKGAINSFTKALAVEVAGRSVTVNAIAPGFIETDMSEAVRNKAGDIIKKMIPMKRLGQPDDIAKVALFLAGPDSAYLTGQVLTVDGGLSLGATAV